MLTKVEFRSGNKSPLNKSKAMLNKYNIMLNKNKKRTTSEQETQAEEDLGLQRLRKGERGTEPGWLRLYALAAT